MNYARTARLVRTQDVALQHKHRKTICQCNHKYDGGESCGTPYLDDAIKQLFLKAANIVFSEMDGVRENYDSIKDTLFGTSELEAERFNEAKERLSEVSQAITEQRAKRERTGRFVSRLEKLDGPLTAFREDDWYSLVDYATVYSREDIRFTFKNGMEIKA